MKKYLVIGNPIEHSLSPKLHNYWIKKNKIDAFYDKKLVEEKDLKEIIYKVKNEELDGINVTVPYKKKVIPFVDQLTPEAKLSESINTIYKKNKKIIGHNTDIGGFELGLRYCKYNVKNKKVFILGAGGVVTSLIYSLKKMGASEIIISNRTNSKTHNIKKLFPYIKVLEWGKIPDFDMILNATSIGLNENDQINLDYEKFGNNKFYYDVIYNPKETNFLKKGKYFGNITENGKMMFIYQAHQAFLIWHKIMPNIDDETIRLLD
tara:strand:- start:613 stop:1404 length:792 start_codon:yes stop_codon:yes gene_type:complete